MVVLGSLVGQARSGIPTPLRTALVYYNRYKPARPNDLPQKGDHGLCLTSSPVVSKAYHEHQYVWLRSGACGPPHTQTGLTDLGDRGLTQSEADDACTLWTGRDRILRAQDIGDTLLVVRMAVV